MIKGMNLNTGNGYSHSINSSLEATGRPIVDDVYHEGGGANSDSLFQSCQVTPDLQKKLDKFDDIFVMSYIL